MYIPIEEFLGKTFTKIDKSVDEITFITNDGIKFRMFHDQDCCESVYVEDIEGDLSDLIGSTIIQAEESTNSENPPHESESFTWTFYKLLLLKNNRFIKFRIK